jgi:hypothetical protein
VYKRRLIIRKSQDSTQEVSKNVGLHSDICHL